MDKVLNLVNKSREALGFKPIKRLPKGIRCNQFCCPLARAIEGCLGVTMDTVVFRNQDSARRVAEAWGVQADKEEVALPPELADFVEEFDYGLFPELEDD